MRGSVLLFAPGLVLISLGYVLGTAAAARRRSPSLLPIRLFGVGFALMWLVPGAAAAWDAAYERQWSLRRSSWRWSSQGCSSSSRPSEPASDPVHTAR